MLEREFLTQSRQASERQLVRQRRTNRRLRALLAGTAVLLAVALIAGLFALVQRDHARTAQNAAQAQALKSDAERIGAVAQTEPNFDRSLLLAVAAVKLKNLPETRGDLLAALQRRPAAFRFIRPSNNEITGLAISSNGELLATGDSAGAVRFEDLKTWRPTGSAIQLPAPVPPLAVRFSPDGRLLAVASGQGNLSQLYVIDVASRHSRLIGSWPGAVMNVPGGSTTIAFSPDGAQIAVALANWPPDAPNPVTERLLLLAASTGKILWQHLAPVLPGQAEAQVAFTQSGTLVTSAEQGNTYLWDPRTGRITRQFPTGGRFALSPNGRLAAIALNSPNGGNQPIALALLDLVTGTERSLRSMPSSAWITSLAYTPDGKRVVGGSLEGDVRVWDVASGSIMQTFVSQSGGRIQVAVDPSGRTVVSAPDDGSVTAWDLSGTQALGRTFAWTAPDNSCPLSPCMVVNPAGTIMATDNYDGTIALVDLHTLRGYANLPGTQGLTANGLAFTPDGRLLVTGDTGGTITFWDTKTRDVVRRLRMADPVFWLAVSPDGRLLAVQTKAAGTVESRVRVLELTSGTVLHTYAVPYGNGGLAFSPDGRELAALGCCSPGSSIEVWDTTSGTELFRPRLAGQAQTMAYSPTSAVLAAGTADGKVFFWDARRGTQLGAPITASASNVLQVTFSPDGRLLAAGLRNGNTILLDLQSRQQLGSSFPVAQAAIPLPLFAPNGDLLINYLGNAADWPTNLAAWDRFACQVAGRDLTPTEWASVLPNRPYQHVCPA